MIPDYYKCGCCGADGVKLFRKSATSQPVMEQPLLCGDCTVRELVEALRGPARLDRVRHVYAAALQASRVTLRGAA